MTGRILKGEAQKILLSSSLYTKIDLDHSNFDFLQFLFDEDIIEKIESRIIPKVENSTYYTAAPIPTISAINAFCPICKTTTSFLSYKSELSSYSEFVNYVTDYTFEIHHRRMESSVEDNLSFRYTFPFYVEKICTFLKDCGTISRNFVCAHSKDQENKHLLTFSFILNENKLIKVGQYPSINDITGLELRKYKKINNDVYLELNKANGLFSHGVGIGSYTYLRRIIEKYIVNEKYTNYLKSTGKTPEESESLTKNTYFKDKVTTLREELSDLLHGNDKIYGFLSKGIHGLSENECLEVFPILFDSICIILDEEIEQMEKEAKKRELASKLNKLK